MIESSPPKDIRGTTLVPEMGRMLRRKPTFEPDMPPWHDPLLKTGQPYSGASSAEKPSGLCLSWPWFVTTSIPKSSKMENIRVLTIGMRYSRLEAKLVSPPMDATP